MISLGILLAVVIILFAGSLLFKGRKMVLKKTKRVEKANVPTLTVCPICKSPLSGARLVTAMITYPDKSIKLRIKGCPRCTKGDMMSRRYCPSCGSKLEVQEPVTADYQKVNGVIKVVIKGCKRCRGSV